MVQRRRAMKDEAPDESGLRRVRYCDSCCEHREVEATAENMSAWRWRDGRTQMENRRWPHGSGRTWQAKEMVRRSVASLAPTSMGGAILHIALDLLDYRLRMRRV